MAVVSVEEIHDNREGAIDLQWKRTYTRTFRVITSSSLDAAPTVLLSLPVSLGQTFQSGFSFDSGSFCNSIRVADEGAEDGRSWIATVEYGPDNPDLHPDDPSQWIPRLQWGFAQFESPCDRDINGNPIVNTAGDPFDPPPMRDDSRPILRITRNELTFDEDLAATYKDTVNHDTFWGKPPKTVKCADISADRKFHEDYGWYYEVTYEFHINLATWVKSVLNAGLRELDSTGMKKNAILDDQGVPTSTPWPLDTNGKALDPPPSGGYTGGTGGATSSNPQGDDSVSNPFYLDFEVYYPADFSVFNFDDFYNSVTQQNQNPQGPFFG